MPAGVPAREAKVKDPKRGHLPELVDPVAKVERCRACKDERRRGEKWSRVCPAATAAERPQAGAG